MLRFFLFFLFFFSYYENIAQQKEYDLFLPITLEIDTTEILVQDFLIDLDIDSVSTDIDYIFSNDKRKIYLISDDDTPTLSTLNLWVKGFSYSILIKKIRKRKLFCHILLMKKIFHK